VVLPTNPPYEVRFEHTTNYHWDVFSQNATEKIGGDPASAEGPFGFGKALELDEDANQCVVDDSFRSADDLCIQDPSNCPEGFAVSLFYKNSFSFNPQDLEEKDLTKFKRRYILSTGGGLGSPGVGIFLKGPYLGADLSTGNSTWSLTIKGTLPRNATWNNIAIRWKPPVTTQEAYNNLTAEKRFDEIGGLEVFLNLDKIGHIIEPKLGCDCDDAPPAGGEGGDGTPAGGEGGDAPPVGGEGGDGTAITTTTAPTTTTEATRSTQGATERSTTRSAEGGTERSTTRSAQRSTEEATQGTTEVTTGIVDCPCTPAYTVQTALRKPTVMLGCHKTNSDQTYRDFLGGVYDEVAVWTKHVPDSELAVFMGGYKESFNSVPMNDLIDMMNGVDMSDPAQADTALDVLNSVVDGGGTTPIFRNIYPTTTPFTTENTGSTESSEAKAATEAGAAKEENATEETTTQQDTTTPVSDTKDFDETMKMKQLLMKMTKLKNVPANVTMDMAMKKMEMSKLVGNVLNPIYTGWHQVGEIPGEGGAHQLRESTEQYLMTVLERTVLDQTGRFALEVHGSNSFQQAYKQSTATAIRTNGAYQSSVQFPMPSNARKRFKRQTNTRTDSIFDNSMLVLNALEEWSDIAEYLEVPKHIFSGSCADKDVSYFFDIIKDFPDPGWKNPVAMEVKNVRLDSKVMSISARANSWNNNQFSESCKPDPKLVLSKKIMIYLTTKSNEKSKRQLMFHEDEETTTIAKRHCVKWNPDIGPHGAWDTKDIKTIAINENSASCMSDKLGTFAILAELVEEPRMDDEMSWLTVCKIMGYITSVISLVIFILMIQLSSYLWEQFNILHMNLSLAIIIGHVCMLVADLEVIKEDRHICTIIGCLIQFSYTAAAVLLTAETHACFKAITSGLVGGRAVMYLPFCWGIPFIILGYDVFVNLKEMGTDPQCMVGWDNFVKWHLFSPIITAAGISLVLMFIVLCNLPNSAVRKTSIIEELSSVAGGLLLTVFLFATTWAFGVLAYIKTPDIALPDFYPVFQVLNSWSGVTTFLFLGVSSTRFRTVIQGDVLNRKDAIMKMAAKDTA